MRKLFVFIVFLSLFSACKDFGVKETSVIEVVKNESYYQMLIEQDSLNAELWNELGEFYFNKNNDSKGIGCLEKSLKLDSSNFAISFKLSELYFKKVALRKSHFYLRHCMKLDSLQTQPYLNIAQIFIFKSDYKSAFKYINLGLRINMYLPQAYFMKGVCYKHLRDTLKSLSSFKTAIEINPDYLASYPEIGLILTHQNDSNGINYYKNALIISPENPELRFGLAWSYQTFGKNELAIMEYESLLKNHPNYINAKFNLGLLYLQGNKTTSSKKLFYEIIRKESNNIEAYYNLYKCAKIEGDSIKANELKLTVLDLDSNFLKTIID